MGTCCCSFARGSSPSIIASVHHTSESISQDKARTSSSKDRNASVILDGQILPESNLKTFSFAELKSITRGFRHDTLLGKGGFGEVHKGWLDQKSSGKSAVVNVVAVKKLNPESLQGFREWQTEVNFLGRLIHPNLVKLLGYCWDNTELLLVYEFMQKGSLENHLFGKGSEVQPLSWETRMKIVIGAARGLSFLHSAEVKVIYRDFKASNILLDASYTAKLSDFGLAKDGPTDSQSHVTTRIMGTNGYAAPEYCATGHLYLKSDVYGFGVVLVEILTGLRALDIGRPGEKHKLVEWIGSYLYTKKKLSKVMDPKLEGRYSLEGAVQVSRLALMCLKSQPKNRPSMEEVVLLLENAAKVNIIFP